MMIDLGEGAVLHKDAVVDCDRLVLGARCHVGRGVLFRGKDVAIGAGSRIGDHTVIDVANRLRIGQGAEIRHHCEIGGRDVEIGRNLFMLPYGRIGGGSSREVRSSLRAGHFLHLGVEALINTAEPVEIGHEVGLGTRTALYTHGAYPSNLLGFPVAFDGISIGDYCWLPGATVNPGVRIGPSCVVGVNSLVTTNLPGGSLAGGSPARVIRESCFPRRLSAAEFAQQVSRVLRRFAENCKERHTVSGSGCRWEIDEALVEYVPQGCAPDDERRQILLCGEPPASIEALSAKHGTVISLRDRVVAGVADGLAERLLNELRRFGTRLWFEAAGGRYVRWGTPPHQVLLGKGPP